MMQDEKRPGEIRTSLAYIPLTTEEYFGDVEKFVLDWFEKRPEYRMIDFTHPMDKQMVIVEYKEIEYVHK